MNRKPVCTLPEVHHVTGTPLVALLSPVLNNAIAGQCSYDDVIDDVFCVKEGKKGQGSDGSCAI
jgi:hypothetical protein